MGSGAAIGMCPSPPDVAICLTLEDQLLYLCEFQIPLEQSWDNNPFLQSCKDLMRLFTGTFMI